MAGHVEYALRLGVHSRLQHDWLLRLLTATIPLRRQGSASSNAQQTSAAVRKASCSTTRLQPFAGLRVLFRHIKEPVQRTRNEEQMHHSFFVHR